MAYTYDAAWSPPNEREARAVGYIGAVRYLSRGTGRNVGKNLTLPERDRLRAADLLIGLVWQDGKENPDALRGGAGGAADAPVAVRLMSTLGMPDAEPFFAIDFNAQPDQYGVCADYMHAVEDVVQRPIGVYGGLRQIEAMHERDAGARYWQTRAWSGGKVSPVACMFQNNGHWDLPDPGGEYDENLVLASDWGQWPRPMSPKTTTRRAAALA